MSSLTNIAQQFTVYIGIPALIAGSLGALLNIIVFLSLHTFRQSPCAFYLTVMSFVNIGQLFTGLFSRIMINGFGIDWTAMSTVYCKIRNYLVQVCTLISLTCFCLATIDQYLATCVYVRLQQWSNLRVAHRLTALFVVIWSSYGVVYLIFWSTVYSSNTGKTSCQYVDAIFTKYSAYVQVATLTGVLPVSITVLFGLLAFRNIQQMSYRTVPMVRQQLEKQLTKMVLIQVAVNSWTLLPIAIVGVLTNTPALSSNPVIATRLQFALSITIVVDYLNFATPFYIYMSVSERFRQQLVYVLVKVHLNRWLPPKITINQITPYF